MRLMKPLCAILPVFVAACAPKGETPVTDSAAPAATPTVDAGAVRRTIDSANARVADALARADTTVLLASYTEDAVTMMPGYPAWRGRSEMAANGSKFFETVKLSDVKFNTTDVDIAGDYAIETGTYEMTVTPKGAKPMADKGKYLTIWKKQADGSWKIYRDISNTSLSPQG